MNQKKTTSLAALAVLALASLTPLASAGPRYSPSQSSSVGFALLQSNMLAAQPLVAQSGWVVITEIMKDPAAVADTKGEWVEVYNALPWRVNLEGCVLSDDGGSQHVITNGGAGLRFLPGRYLVLGNNADLATNGGVHVDYVYNSFSLGNGADQVILSRADGVVLDRVDYDDGVTFPDAAGKSLSLKIAARDAVSNDSGASWCPASSAISATNADAGTPGADNDSCP